MKREELRDQIAPCSLLCYTCSAYEKGVIRTLSKELLHYTQSLAEFYQRHLPKEEQDYAQRFLQVRAELSRYATRFPAKNPRSFLSGKSMSSGARGTNGSGNGASKNSGSIAATNPITGRTAAANKKQPFYLEYRRKTQKVARVLSILPHLW